MPPLRTIVGPALLLCAGACRTGLNYTGVAGPRYAGGPAPALHFVSAHSPNRIRVVTFNIQFAVQIDRAIAVLDSTTELYDADVIMLQEMDAPGTARIAAALGMRYVYYPATVHPKTGRDFGNAILSRWPIVADEKIILPHLARFEKTERIATAATIQVGDHALRVYSLHLATRFAIGPQSRRDQVAAVLADAASYPQVIIAGDMNSHGIGRTLRANGYEWPTEHNPATDWLFSFDHVFLKGLDPDSGSSTGVIHNNRGASDHRPVWAVVSLQAPAATPHMPVAAQP